ncbi:uncharacterized protein F4822DRAFT_349404 [Hypoxylon trugodes]|uniref:uncharacterized protein n=1 Tax=Hypoxylon trugodes TaxID=326681 RepID=UPI00219839A6|nr:uncharacterized protein F4822DRAFT_349404 [Hypoxylon trugodes]KAI1385620.1 hypothetical protein F4822DRAFT_349404 [Hypoxylon trugodes]
MEADDDPFHESDNGLPIAGPSGTSRVSAPQQPTGSVVYHPAPSAASHRSSSIPGVIPAVALGLRGRVTRRISQAASGSANQRSTHLVIPPATPRNANRGPSQLGTTEEALDEAAIAAIAAGATTLPDPQPAPLELPTPSAGPAAPSATPTGEWPAASDTVVRPAPGPFLYESTNMEEFKRRDDEKREKRRERERDRAQKKEEKAKLKAAAETTASEAMYNHNHPGTQSADRRIKPSPSFGGSLRRAFQTAFKLSGVNTSSATSESPAPSADDENETESGEGQSGQSGQGQVQDRSHHTH